MGRTRDYITIINPDKGSPKPVEYKNFVEVSDRTILKPLSEKRLSKNKNVISFSLYGSHDIYNIGAVENIAEGKEYFPDWKLRFYVDESSPALDELLRMDCEVITMKKPRGILGMFWRFLAMDDETIDRVLIRDTDQRLNDKDAQAVNEWVKSGKMAHRMREGENQCGIPLMGCAIGFKCEKLRGIEDSIFQWMGQRHGCIIGHECKQAHNSPVVLTYGADQLFLTDVVWPVVEKDCLTHGVEGNPFPSYTKRLKWDKSENACMFRRILPNTNCELTFGDRPSYVYEAENK